MSHELTCQQLIGFLDDYVAGAIDAAERGVFETHLRDCLHCREYLREYQRSIDLAKGLRETGEGAVPDGVPKGLVAAVRRAITERSKPR